MTPKQKAEELIAQYEKLMIGNYLTSHKDHKNMALIAVDEIIGTLDRLVVAGNYWTYWNEVKTEIESQ